MICNPSKCKELVVGKKKNNTHHVYGASESDLNIIQRFFGSLPQAPLCLFSRSY